MRFNRTNWTVRKSSNIFVETIEVFLNPFAKGLAKLLPITVCDEIFNLQIHKSTCDFCQIFLLDKRSFMRFCIVYPKKPNEHLLYSFIHVFIHNSITKYCWQNFAKALAKAFRKTPYFISVQENSCTGGCNAVFGRGRCCFDGARCSHQQDSVLRRAPSLQYLTFSSHSPLLF